jgi:hypothetical protein
MSTERKQEIALNLKDVRENMSQVLNGQRQVRKSQKKIKHLND